MLKTHYFPGTRIINSQNQHQLKHLLVDPSVHHIVLDFKITGNNFNKLRAALNLRAQYPTHVEFMEIQSIPRNFLVWLFTFMEEGTLIEGQRIFFTPAKMGLKIPLYEKQGIQDCIDINYPRLKSVLIIL